MKAVALAVGYVVLAALLGATMWFVTGADAPWWRFALAGPGLVAAVVAGRHLSRRLRPVKTPTFVAAGYLLLATLLGTAMWLLAGAETSWTRFAFLGLGMVAGAAGGAYLRRRLHRVPHNGVS